MSGGYTEMQLETLLQSQNLPQSFEGKESLWQRVCTGTAPAGRTARREPRRLVRMAVLAMAFMLLAATGVFAGNVLQKMRAENVGVALHDALAPQDGQDIVARVTLITDETVPPLPEGAAGKGAEKKEYVSVEDLESAVDFAVKAPAYLPEGYAFTHCEAFPRESALGNHAFIYYGKPDDSTAHILCVEQALVGEGGKVDVDYIGGEGQMQAVQVNGCDGIYAPGYGLLWIEGGIYYCVGGSNAPGALSLEELLAVAVSLQAAP